jgi:hypothetical protein
VIRSRAALGAVAALAAASCATLADGHAGLDDPPSARVGPFRLLVPGEIGANHPAPFAMNDGHAFWRDASVVRTAASGFDVDAFFAGVAEGAGPDDATDRIARFHAVDGRSFPASGDIVLTATEDWEGGHVGAPSAVVVNGSAWLFYEGANGIGVAKVDASGAFAPRSEPVLSASSVAWSGGVAPRSPGVVVLRDGSLRMFFELDTGAGPVIGEARSIDGETWEAIGDGPVLARGPAGAPDALGVATPAPVLATSEQGRDIVDVYYTALGANGPVVGLASRFVLDGAGALERSPSIMLGPSAALAVREPCAVRFDAFTLLFATENASKTSTDPAVVVGLAPATEELPPANPR